MRNATTSPPQSLLSHTLPSANCLFLLLPLLRTLRLRRSSKFLGSILPLLPLLSARLLNLRRKSHSDKSVMRLEFLHRFDGVVDQGESRRLAAAILRAHAENIDLVFVGFVDFG
jgi:hypothetical protein